MWTVQPSVIPQNRNVERKSKNFPFIMAYTSRPSMPTTCDRTSSIHPLTTDVDMPTFPLTKNWTGWTLYCASQVPDRTELLVPSHAAAALVTSTVSATTASLTSLQLMMGWCLSIQNLRCAERKLWQHQGPKRRNLQINFRRNQGNRERNTFPHLLVYLCKIAPLGASNCKLQIPMNQTS